MLITNTKRVSFNLAPTILGGTIILFDIPKPAQIPATFEIDDTGRMNVGDAAALFLPTTRIEPSQTFYHQNPLKFTSNASGTLAIGSAQKLAPGKTWKHVSKAADHDRWIITPDYAKGFYDLNEPLRSLNTFYGETTLHLTNPWEGRDWAYFEYKEEVTIKEIYWTFATGRYQDARYCTFEFFNEVSGEWEKVATNNSSGSYGSNVATNDSDIIHLGGSNYLKDLSETPMVGKRFRFKTYNSYTIASFAFVTDVKPTNMPEKREPTWGIHVDTAGNLLYMFDVGADGGVEKDFNMVNTLENAQSLETIGIHVLMPSHASPLEKQMHDAGVDAFDSTGFRGWQRLGIIGETPDVGNWPAVYAGCQFGIKLIDPINKVVKGWIHKDELEVGNGTKMSDLSGLYKGNSAGGSSESTYLYRYDDGTTVHRVAFEGPEIGFNLTRSKDGYQRAVYPGSVSIMNWEVWIDSTVKPAPYDQSSLAGPANMNITDETAWEDGSWVKGDITNGRLWNNNYADYGGPDSVQLHPAGSYIEFTLDGATGLEITQNTILDDLIIKRMSDGHEVTLTGFTSQIPRTVNLSAGGTYRAISTGNLVLSEFKPVQQVPGPDLVFSAP